MRLTDRQIRYRVYGAIFTLIEQHIDNGGEFFLRESDSQADEDKLMKFADGVAQEMYNRFCRARDAISTEERR